MLGLIFWILQLDKSPLFHLPHALAVFVANGSTEVMHHVEEVTLKDLILFGGGLFLLWKGTQEIHSAVEGTGHHAICSALAPRYPHCNHGPCFKTDLHAEALFRSWIYASASEFRSARQQISARLATYHQPADGIGNSSLRRMLVQCRDDLGSGLGFKLSYPDDALSLARDSEKEGKTTAHGNVAALAQLAEDARIDFRVLVLTRDLASAARSRMQPNATAAAIFSAAADHASRHAHRDAELARSHPELTSEARRWHAELRWPASGGLSRRPFESSCRIRARYLRFECL